MRCNCTARVGIGLVGALVTAGCGGAPGGGDYATKREFEALKVKYIATHDTMLALWKATDSMNKILELKIIPNIDTTPPRPKCPPRCLNVIPPLPTPYAP